MTDAPAPIPHTADTPATTPPPAPRRRRRWLRGLLILLFLLIAIPLGLVAWLLGSESGLRQAAALANRFGGGMIEIDEVSGRVLDGMRLGEVRVQLFEHFQRERAALVVLLVEEAQGGDFVFVLGDGVGKALNHGLGRAFCLLAEAAEGDLVEVDVVDELLALATGVFDLVAQFRTIK